MTTRPKILCVDDEEFILTSLTRLLRTEFTVLTAPSGRKALELLGHNPDIAAAVVDQRMPEMSGSELLEQMHQHYPHVVKIVLTGYTDMSALIDSINKGEIFRYIQKPWDPDVLRSAIQNAVIRHEDYLKSQLMQASLAQTEAKLQQIIAEMQRLRTSHQ